MRVSLFITCLVDMLYPEVGIGMVRVLDRLGVSTEFPRAQTCCGQPAFNSGCPDDARRVARQFLVAFRDAEIVVTPSGSCAAMAKVHLPRLFAPESEERALAEAIAGRIHEFSDYLVNVLKVCEVGASFPRRVTYHDSCHLLRGLRIRDEPRELLARVGGLTFIESRASDACCGFGGTFAVRLPEISAAMGSEKIARIEESGAEYVVANDTGCLMHLRGMLARSGSRIGALHLAEVLGAEGTRD